MTGSDNDEQKQLPVWSKEPTFSYDFVLNPYLLWESRSKEDKSLLRHFQPIHSASKDSQVPFRNFVYILSIWMGATIPLLVVPFLVAALGFGSLSYMLLLSLMACVCFLVYTSDCASLPTNFQIGEKGFRLQWCGNKAKSTALFPWSALKSVSVSGQGQAGQEATTCLVLSVDWEALSWKARFQSLFKLGAIWTYGVPWDLSRGGYFTKHLSLQIPLFALTRDADRRGILTAVQMHLPAPVIEQSFLDMVQESGQLTFTKLWLDDANRSFRRQSMEPHAPGSSLQNGRYRITDLIATGGQATVYRAEDAHSQSPLAIKEFILPVSGGGHVRERSLANIKNEALLLSSLNHSGIVKLHDQFLEDHRAYLVLENVDGMSLRQLVQENGAQSHRHVAGWALQMCRILSYLHQQAPPVVHRDFTPDNLLLATDSQIKLVDFNVANRLESSSTQTVVGKHNYMAPEQFKGRACPQSDLYSLGGTLYYLLTAHDPVPLSRSLIAADVQVDSAFTVLAQVISKLTQTDLQERYQSTEQVSQDLKQIWAEEENPNQSLTSRAG